MNDPKKLFEFFSNNFKQFIVVLVVVIFSGGGAISFLRSEYMQIDQIKSELNKKELALQNEKIAFLNMNNLRDREYDKKVNELHLRELRIEDSEKIILSKTQELDSKISEYKSAYTEVIKAQEAWGVEARIAQAEEKLLKLMSEFTDLGVNISNSPPCGDEKMKTLWGKANSKFNQIRALAEANGLYQRYRAFFSQYSMRTITVC
ncbi:hypothetical protein [Thalassospira sp. MCCC 1A03138]|uniref:hypothetical protein n=1 Tax=Thalassospira sp. MCCC 1A03138 TaxID=1470576 RepID=UPI000A1DCDBF|nr:hypothetical protein [Thalassospira sp. MCCC 1A03138]OSQ30142.1 hypothetical protein TH468_11780 [Thalassospira sp. MCCC 1A03138]